MEGVQGLSISCVSQLSVSEGHFLKAAEFDIVDVAASEGDRGRSACPPPPQSVDLFEGCMCLFLICDDSSSGFAQRSSSDHIIRMLNTIHICRSAAQSSHVLIGPGNPVVPLVL